jgi:tight adherence protein B
MTFLVILIVIWVCSMAIWYLISGAFRSADVDRIRQRLQGTSGDKKKAKKEAGQQPASLLQHEDPVAQKMFVTRMLQKYKVHGALQTLIEQAGLKWHVARLVQTCMAFFLGGFLIGWQLTGMQLTGLAGGVFAGSLPFLHVYRKRKARLHKFEEQFPESLEFVARSMRAGHAFSVSLEMIFREFQEPLAGEFRRTFEEHNLGLPLESALQKLAKRVPLLDVHFFVSAVMLQKRTGGNLAEILDKLAYVIRERFKLRGRIRAISAHGRMTGVALTLIPVVVAIMMFYVNPEYARFFFIDETGHYMAGAAIGLQVIGYLIIQKIVQIEV